MKLTARWDTFVDWMNVDIWNKVRRIDIALVLAGIFCIAYYAQYGWLSALAGALMYIMVVMISVWLL